MTRQLSYKEPELVVQLRKHNKQAYAYLYDTYSPALYTCILQMVKEEDRATNVTSEAFLCIWKEITEYDAAKERLFTWLSKIARRVALEEVQRQHDRQHFLQLDPDGDGTTAKEAHALLDHCGLKAVMHTLSREQATLVNLSYFEGLTNKQIAETMQMPEETVQQKMRSTLKELNNLLR